MNYVKPNKKISNKKTGQLSENDSEDPVISKRSKSGIKIVKNQFFYT